MRMTIRWAGLAVLAAAGVAQAHHGWSSYDEAKVMTLTGVIRASTYEMPHGTIELEVEKPAAKTWHVVLAPPSRMKSRGLPAEGLKVGTEATVVAYPSKEKPEECRAERITIAGKTTELR
jgi:Family of unknown function (DUF6152)